MNVVRDRADARWFPWRYRFAIFKLIGWIVFSASQPRPQTGLVLAMDRDQSTVESYTVAVWLVANAALFLFSVLLAHMLWPAALFLAIGVAIITPQAIVTLPAAGSRAFRQQSHIDQISFVMMFLMTAFAIYLAGRDGWVRYVAWAFLIALLLNAAAAVVVRLLRGRIERAGRTLVAP